MKRGIGRGRGEEDDVDVDEERGLFLFSSSTKVKEEEEEEEENNEENDDDENYEEEDNETPKTPETPVLPSVETSLSKASSEEHHRELKKCKSCIPSFKEVDENTTSSNVGETVDPRYTYCEFCKTKHTKLVWGDYRRVTEEISHAATKKSMYRIRTGTWICKGAYEFLMDTTGTVPHPQDQNANTVMGGAVQQLPAQDMKRSSSVLVNGSLPGLDAQGAKRAPIPLSSAAQISEPDRKMLKLSMDKAAELKQKADSLLLSQRLLNSNIKTMLLELKQRNNSTSNEESEEWNEGDYEEEDFKMDMKKLDDILDKIESAQSSLIKTRCGGTFGKFSNDVFTELAGLKYSIIEFRDSLSAHKNE